MNHVTTTGRTAIQLCTAAAAARRIAAERETRGVHEQRRGSAGRPHHPETTAPGSGYDSPSIRIRDIASRLNAAGLAADVAEIPSVGLYLVVAAHSRSSTNAEVILDDEGYAELRWWPCLDGSADEITDQLLSLLRVITTRPTPVSSVSRRPDSVQAPSRTATNDRPPVT
jgi:hypothetical protein